MTNVMPSVPKTEHIYRGVAMTTIYGRTIVETLTVTANPQNAAEPTTFVMQNVTGESAAIYGLQQLLSTGSAYLMFSTDTEVFKARNVRSTAFGELRFRNDSCICVSSISAMSETPCSRLFRDNATSWQSLLSRLSPAVKQRLLYKLLKLQLSERISDGDIAFRAADPANGIAADLYSPETGESFIK